MYFQFLDPFMQSLAKDKLEAIEERRKRWNIDPDSFYETLDNWFSNFGNRDKELALKILFSVQYFNEADFSKRMQHLWSNVQRYLSETSTPLTRVILVVPNERGDSADMHAYAALKSFGLPQCQVVEVAKLDRFEKSETVLVFLNDTHGTGTQFIREFGETVNFQEFKCVFVLGVVFSRKAIRRFQQEMKGVVVFPSAPSVSADLVLNGEEWERVKGLGNKVYPKHPIGFGDAALLVAYHFQCPNNTLPIIWANGVNNKVGELSYPWRPLFAYRQKAITAEPRRELSQPDILRPIDFSTLSFELSDNEKVELEGIAGELTRSFGSRHINIQGWLGNFRAEEKSLAIGLLSNFKHWDIMRTRRAIQELRQRVIAEIARHGSEMDDVLMVTTGSEQASTYHYVSEFMREWHLEARQVVDAAQLNESRALDKHLVFFYHTRPPGREFFEPKEMLKDRSYFEIAKRARPISTILCSFAEAPGFKSVLEQEASKEGMLARISIREASRSVKEAIGDDFDAYASIISNFVGGSSRYSPDEHLLVSFYFRVPEITSPLFWRSGIGRDGRTWVPLYID